MSSTTNYYECHVTLSPKHAKAIEPVAQIYKFKTSILVGDEVMGDAALLYCIAAFPEDVSILRKKIEHVVLDVRYDKITSLTFRRI